jgi:hypothetical protein
MLWIVWEDFSMESDEIVTVYRFTSMNAAREVVTSIYKTPRPSIPPEGVVVTGSGEEVKRSQLDPDQRYVSAPGSTN